MKTLAGAALGALILMAGASPALAGGYWDGDGMPYENGAQCERDCPPCPGWRDEDWRGDRDADRDEGWREESWREDGGRVEREHVLLPAELFEGGGGVGPDTFIDEGGGGGGFVGGAAFGSASAFAFSSASAHADVHVDIRERQRHQMMMHPMQPHMMMQHHMMMSHGGGHGRW
jgi:hypothetical protein